MVCEIYQNDMAIHANICGIMPIIGGYLDEQVMRYGYAVFRKAITNNVQLS